MKPPWSRKLIPGSIVSAFLGVLVLTIGMTNSFEAYNQQHIEHYSPANHFISELGWEKRSPGADWFNGSLAAFCLGSLPLMIALGFHLRNRPGYLGTFFGVTMLLAGVAVAFFPLDRLHAHLLSALVLFWAYLLAMATFTVAFLFHRRSGWSLLMAVVSLLCVGVGVTFLALPKDAVGSALRNIHEFERPAVWWLTIFEWGILVFGILWGAMAAAMLFFRSSERQA